MALVCTSASPNFSRLCFKGDKHLFLVSHIPLVLIHLVDVGLYMLQQNVT